MNYFKRARAKRVNEAKNGHAESSDPAKMDPNFMRDAVRSALLSLPLDERARARDRILSSLRKAGLDLGTLLILLGINVKLADELTPSDLAHLIRYLRLTSAAKLDAVKPEIVGLLGVEEKVRKTHETRKAA